MWLKRKHLQLRLLRRKRHLPTNEIRKVTENEQDRAPIENQRRNQLLPLHKKNEKHQATNPIFRERNRAIKDRRVAEEEDVN